MEEKAGQKAAGIVRKKIGLRHARMTITYGDGRKRDILVEDVRLIPAEEVNDPVPPDPNHGGRFRMDQGDGTTFEFTFHPTPGALEGFFEEMNSFKPHVAEAHLQEAVHHLNRLREELLSSKAATWSGPYLECVNAMLEAASRVSWPKNGVEFIDND